MPKENFVRKVVRMCVASETNGMQRISSTLGVSERALYRWINGDCEVPASAFIAICDLMGIDFSIEGKYLRRANRKTYDESEDSPVLIYIQQIFSHFDTYVKNTSATIYIFR